MTTVAASTTQRAFGSTLSLAASDGAELKLAGATITAGVDTATPLVVAAAVGDPLCLDDTADVVGLTQDLGAVAPSVATAPGQFFTKSGVRFSRNAA